MPIQSCSNQNRIHTSNQDGATNANTANRAAGAGGVVMNSGQGVAQADADISNPSLGTIIPLFVPGTTRVDPGSAQPVRTSVPPPDENETTVGSVLKAHASFFGEYLRCLGEMFCLLIFPFSR